MKTIEAIQKEKRFMLVLPVIIFPFLTLLFWSMGGGQGQAEEIQVGIQGFNAELPDARLDDKDMDKMALYELAGKDAAKMREHARNDPYYNSGELMEENEAFDPSFRSFEAYNPREKEVYDKLERLNNVLEQSSRQDVHEPSYSKSYITTEQQHLKEDIARLEKMMQVMQSGSNEPDREMEDINRVLESVLDIQHPERVQERLRQTSTENRGMVYAVSSQQTESPISLLENRSVKEYAKSFSDNPKKRENKFQGMENPNPDEEEQTNSSIIAVVHEDQTVVSGSTVKLRLQQDIFINGHRIAKDNFVFGTASLNGERLEIIIKDIRSGAFLYTVQLAVHDIDGMPGIKVPGGIARDAAKQSGDRAIQGMNIGTFNPSLGAQAASAGIELGKNFLSRKVKLIKVDLKAGYRVLLKDNKRKDY